MAPGGFLTLIQRLDYDQWSAVVDTGFGGMLALRTKLIPKQMGRWLLERYNPWDNSLHLENGKLLIDEEDVYATLGLPMGNLEIIEGQHSEEDIEFLQSWRRRWNVERGGPPIGSMHELILERGGHGHEFLTDFITYAISSCIVGNANGTCHFRVVKYLRNMEEIKNYNWCAYALKCLNDAVIEWKKDKAKFFTGSLLFLMLCYMDRVQFRGKRIERSFPIAINWDTEKVRSREKDEQLSGRYGQGRIMNRIDYESITQSAEADLKAYNEELRRQQAQDDSANEVREENRNTQRCPFCPHCNEDRDNIVHDYDQPMQDNVTTKAPDQQRNTSTEMQGEKTPPNTGHQPSANENTEECVSPVDAYYCSTEFLEQLDKIESIAREQLQQKKKRACSPPRFDIGIALDEEAAAAHIADTAHDPVQMQKQQKTGPAAAKATTSAAATADQTEELAKKDMNPEISLEDSKQAKKAATTEELEKGKKVMKRQQPKRMAQQVPYQCRSPYLKDYRDAREQLSSEQLMLVDYAFLPPDDKHPSMEKLFEYGDEDTKLWLFREAFETLAGVDRDLEKSIVDVLCLILNWMERQRNPMRRKRMYFTTNVFMAIENETDNLQNIFKGVMDLERKRYKWLKLSEAQLVFFTVLEHHHFYVLCYDFANKKIIVLDNRLEGENPTSRYKYSAMAMTNLFASYLIEGRHKKGIDVRRFKLVFWNLEWQDDQNMHDCGIYAIRHMEAFQGGNNKYWTTGFEKNKVEFIRQLRSKYAAMILQSELNEVRAQVEQAAKEEFNKGQ